MFDIDQFMVGLASQRAIFHSEADFQHAFAWQFHEVFPEARVRLEYPFYAGKWIYIDLWLDTPSQKLAIELKYKSRTLETLHGDEHFRLKSHSAQDSGRYDFLKDVARLEKVSMNSSNVSGYAVLLTNDPSYWGTGRIGTVDVNFRLHPGREITGDMGWLPNAAPGTIRGRTEPLHLSGSYTVEWKPYSRLDAISGGEFRYLAFRV